MWDTGSIPTELGWNVLLFIPKGNADTQGIGLLEVVWKVGEAVINTRIKSVVKLHNVLRGVFTGRGTGTTIMELKLFQEFSSVDQDPLFLLLLDIRKEYNNLDRQRLLQNL